MVEVVTGYSYFRDSILRGIPPEQALAAFLQAGINNHLWTVGDIRRAAETILASSHNPQSTWQTYYDLSHNPSTREFRVGGKSRFLSPNRTRFLAHLISQPEIPHSTERLYAAVWGEWNPEFTKENSSNLRYMVSEVRDDTADTIIPADKLPETGQFSRKIFHRIQTVWGEGYMLRRVWDVDEIAQGRNRLWTPGF